MSRKQLLVLLVLLALAAGALALYSSWNGPVGFSDTAAYLSSGRNWARGIGLGVFQPSGDFEALTVHPPLYALYFGVLHFLGIDLISGGRWLNLLAAALTTLALGLLFLRHSRVPWLSLLAAALFIVFPSVIEAFAALMTDGVFLVLWLWGLLALFAYLDGGLRQQLLAAILLFSSLPLLRYIGLAFLIAGVLIVWLWHTGAWRQRLRIASLFGAGALAPSLLWQLLSYLTLERGVAGRGLTSGQIDYSDAFTDFSLRLAAIIHGWNPFVELPALNSPWPSLLTLAALAGLAAFLVFRLNQGAPAAARAADSRSFWAFALTALVFLGSVAATFIFTRPTPDVIDRTLLPLFICLLVCAFSLLALASSWRPRLVQAVALLGAAILLLVFGRAGYETAIPLHRGQVGYFTNAWRQSALIDQLAALPADQSIIASQASLVLFWADRPALEMLPYLPPGFLARGTPYGSDPEHDRWQALFRQGAALVLFAEHPTWLYADYGPGLTQGLQLLGQYPEGAMYEFNGP